jgi:L-fuculose-phosphate aldolase
MSGGNTLIIDICHRLYTNGFVMATDGNVSVRLENGRILTTRTSVNKGMVTEADLVETDDRGIPVSSGLNASTELGMHLYIYAQRNDVHAVVHAHPPYATGFAAARLPLDEPLLPEVIVTFGSVPLAEYATPSTEEVARSLTPFVHTYDAVLLSNHGVVTYGKDLWDAYFKMEKVEQAAHIAFIAKMLGGTTPLDAGQIARLRAISARSYGKEIPDKNFRTEIPPEDAVKASPASADETTREIIRHMLSGKP